MVSVPAWPATKPIPAVPELAVLWTVPPLTTTSLQIATVPAELIFSNPPDAMVVVVAAPAVVLPL